MDTASTPRHARSGDTWDLALAHSTSIFDRRWAVLRWMAYPHAVAFFPGLAAWVGRGEVYRVGRTAVVMSPKGARRSVATAAVRVLLAYFAAIVAVGTLASAGTVLLHTQSFAAAFLAAAGLLIVVVLIGASWHWPRPDQRRAVAALGKDSPVVILHDLARPPSDVRGSGTGLVAAIIRHPDFAGHAIVATAAADTLADRYEELAGMIRFAPASRTVYYRA